MQKILSFVKKEAVLCIAALLAVVSTFLVPFDPVCMWNAIDFRTLCLLFALMGVVVGFRKAGTLSAISHGLLGKIHSARGMTLCLVLLCFFTSMLITNDVALLTFVPLAVLLLESAGLENRLIHTVVLQTIAANLGSMLTPIGNPQNLYLYELSGMEIGAFVLTLLPYAALSLLLLVAACCLPKNAPLSPVLQSAPTRSTHTELLCLGLFLLCLLCVLHVLESWVAALAVAVVFLVFHRRLLLQIDYGLLLTFVCFFLFIGNIGRIPPVNAFLQEIVQGRELLMGVLSSQIISNVPAALLLSGFTTQLRPLLIGVNLGGLGTLIASLASLIAFRLYGTAQNPRRGRFMLVFTAYNLLFLLLLLGLSLLIG